jgi:DMSO/TMAO reductase YedYZ molybdopterin-dependent catalytic subunit
MKQRYDLRIGALVGLATTLALAGVLYLLAQLQALPFIPLDIAQAITYLAPGGVATEGIEALGPLAKTLVALSGFAIFLLAGTAMGALLARQHESISLSSGLVVGLAALVLTVVAQFLARRFPDTLALGLMALLLLGWGVVLVGLVRRALAEAPSSTPLVPERRAFLRRSGGILLTVAVGSAAVGELLRRAAEEQLTQQAASGDGTAVLPGALLPAPAAIATEPGAGAGVVADPAFSPGLGARPELTPTDKLYVVATTFNPPYVDTRRWRLIIKGLVDRPITLAYEDLLALPRVDQTSTLTCISNEVGGDLIGNITWSGTRLRDLLQRAGVQPGAVDVVLRSVEGYTDSIPLERALNPQTLIAYGMNGTTLTVEHGFPARLIVPGIYGMKNVKWLGEIEVVGEDYKGFWEQRGWSDTAIVKTQSAIDTANPALGNDQRIALENGKVVLGGYAFAGDRGIERVEVQIDGGAWQPAQLKRPTSRLTWREWRYEWTATPGDHVVVVRAIDGSGALQTDVQAEPHPDGASGWHTLRIRVA